MFFSCKALQRTVFVHSKLPPLLPISDQSILAANWCKQTSPTGPWLVSYIHGWSHHYPHMAIFRCRILASKDSLPSSKTMNNDLKPQSCLAFNGRIGGPSTDACPYSCGIIRIYDIMIYFQGSHLVVFEVSSPSTPLWSPQPKTMCHTYIQGQTHWTNDSSDDDIWWRSPLINLGLWGSFSQVRWHSSATDNSRLTKPQFNDAYTPHELTTPGFLNETDMFRETQTRCPDQACRWNPLNS